jgi:molybdate transport system substrate-binding protein
MRHSISRILLLVLLLSLTLHGADTISVAAAADLQYAMKDIAAKFEQATGNKVQFTFGSSGNFFAQINNGATFDVFFSADIDYPKKLEEAGLAEPGSVYQYATGKIVLWTRSDSGIDLKDGLKVLLDSRVRRIAIANPQHAPYGRAAAAAIQNAGIYEKVQDKLVFGENISQAAQFASTGNAEIGIIALSLAKAPAMSSIGKMVEIPTDSYPPLRQGCIVLKASQNKAAARAFVDFLKKPETQELLRSYGFSQ